MVPRHTTIRLGLCLSYSASATFFGSCNSICLQAAQLLSPYFHDLTFPYEDQAVALFEVQSSAIFIPGATQCDLQAMVDHCHNIRNQVRLMALSHCLGLVVGSRPYLNLL